MARPIGPKKVQCYNDTFKAAAVINRHRLHSGIDSRTPESMRKWAVNPHLLFRRKIRAA